MHDPKASPPLAPGRCDRRSIPRYEGVLRSESMARFNLRVNLNLCKAIRFPLRSNMHLVPRQNADLHHVELTRIGTGETIGAPLIYDLSSIESHAAPDVPLAPNDRLIVRSLPEENRAAVVEVRGEVGEPGVYPIEDGHTTLYQVIQEAGGLNRKAYPAAGVIKRHGHDERLTAGSPEEVAQITRLLPSPFPILRVFEKQIAMRPLNVVADMYRLFLCKADHSADVKT